ncbi:alpha-N-acetylgalactosaminide alpha-2,6-sialyltransferase 1-like [Amphiura filiformis]|uniref:alpha-N-acetylgalactosaminide alpha-2,6-sialyltransferase 1-like n=1 Tax=Amphiura filiformis TaxID=82378 RepID=UPI003B226C45
MSVKRMYLYISLVSLFSMILLWLTSISPLYLTASYQRLIAERYQTTWSVEKAFRTNWIPVEANQTTRGTPKLEAAKTTKDSSENYTHDLQYLKYMQCSNSLRHRMKSRKALKGKYIPDVPILLTPEHVTKSEYDRLKAFRDMMGWKHSKYEFVAKAMSLLNTTSHKYLFDDILDNNTRGTGTCTRCAVIGNGGILNGSRMGKEIDSHDYVFRTNAAITEGHEEDVGSKTSFYCFGMVTLSNAISRMKNKGFPKPPWNPKIRYIFFPENDWAYRYIYAALTNRTLPKGNTGIYAKREPFIFPKPLIAEEIKIIHPDFCRYVDKTWLKSPKLRTGGRATTGAIMLFLALHTCDEVNGFGYMGDPDRFTYYYYDQTFVKQSLTKASNHDWQRENTLWKLLIDEGIFHMYTRD